MRVERIIAPAMPEGLGGIARSRIAARERRRERGLNRPVRSKARRCRPFPIQRRNVREFADSA